MGITGVLAALAADSSKIRLTLQVAYAHLFFNLSGIVVWYVVWPMRALPVSAAKFLGNTTAKYRWFALAYLFLCFFLIPFIFMGLSIASTAACVVIAVICFLLLIFVVSVNVAQARKPSILPAKLQTWDFLPAWMTSLETIDRIFCGCCKKNLDVDVADNTAVSSTPA